MAPGQHSENRPTPLKLDEVTLGRWAALRAAVDAEEDWLALQTDGRRLAARFYGLERSCQRALIAPLANVTPRVRDLIEGGEEQREVIRLNLHDLAWEFTSHAYDLRFENRVRHTDGVAHTLSADRLPLVRQCRARRSGLGRPPPQERRKCRQTKNLDFSAQQAVDQSVSGVIAGDPSAPLDADGVLRP